MRNSVCLLLANRAFSAVPLFRSEKKSIHSCYTKDSVKFEIGWRDTERLHDADDIAEDLHCEKQQCENYAGTSGNQHLVRVRVYT